MADDTSRRDEQSRVKTASAPRPFPATRPRRTITREWLLIAGLVVVFAAVWLHLDQPWIWGQFKHKYIKADDHGPLVPMEICGSPVPDKNGNYPTDHCVTVMGYPGTRNNLPRISYPTEGPVAPSESHEGKKD